MSVIWIHGWNLVLEKVGIMEVITVTTKGILPSAVFS